MIKEGPSDGDNFEFKLANIVQYYRNIPCTVKNQTSAQTIREGGSTQEGRREGNC